MNKTDATETIITILLGVATLIGVLAGAPDFYHPAYVFLAQGQLVLAIDCAAAGAAIMLIKTATIVAVERLILNHIFQTFRHGVR